MFGVAYAMPSVINTHFDMETADPDDVMTLCMLSHHPLVNLVSVSITPGSRAQVGLVRHVLARLEKDIPVGSRKVNHTKDCVSEFHYKWLGQIGVAEPDGTGAEVMERSLHKYPDLNIICGASLGNIGALLDLDVVVPRIVVQGGFAGESIVDPEHMLEKFRGRVTCPTFNLNGDVTSAKKLLNSMKVDRRLFVSKNVCHGVIYDGDFHDWIQRQPFINPGVALLIEGMTAYRGKRAGWGRREGEGKDKAFHDPLAAAALIDQRVCEFKEVELYSEKGPYGHEWGSRYSEDPNCKISVSMNKPMFRDLVVGRYWVDAQIVPASPPHDPPPSIEDIDDLLDTRFYTE